ncbi:hypothetical protein CHS0354_030925, partial [Potamilus streckersoni]
RTPPKPAARRRAQGEPIPQQGIANRGAVLVSIVVFAPESSSNRYAIMFLNSFQSRTPGRISIHGTVEEEVEKR